jgi:ABC-type multidrug transport system fused ATPase/permease subunit
MGRASVRSLQKTTVNRTAIAIAHRLPTLRNTDCIYVTEQINWWNGAPTKNC